MLTTTSFCYAVIFEKKHFLVLFQMGVSISFTLTSMMTDWLRPNNQPKNPNTKPRLQKLNSQSASTKTMPHGKHQNLCQMQVHSDQNRQLSTGNTTTTITTTILLRCNLQFVDVYITVQFGLWLRLFHVNVIYRFSSISRSTRAIFKFQKLRSLLEIAQNILIVDRKSTRLNSSHPSRSRMPSSAWKKKKKKQKHNNTNNKQTWLNIIH